MSGVLHRTFSFANVPVGANPVPSGSGSSTAGGAQESLLTRILVGPMLFISFIVSLLIIDNETSSSILQKPESRGSGRKNDNVAPEKGKEGYYHSHQRHLMKQEMDDAFRLRNRVIVGICVVSALILAALSWFGMVLLEFLGMGYWKRTTAA